MLLSDLRYAIRSLSRARGFTLAVVLTLGLGIGANTAIFSVVRAVLLKPLPHRNGDRLIYLRQSVNGPGGEDIAFSVPEILDFKDAKSFGGIAEYSDFVLTLQGEKESVRMNIGLVTGNYFNVMGLSPVLGRLLNEGDDGTNVPAVMVLTYEYWQKRFAGDPTVIGRVVRMGGKPVTVVGIVQPAPSFPTKVDALLNMVISEHHTSALMVQGRTHRMTQMIVRLAPGATVTQARAEVATIRANVQKQYPDAYDPGSGYRVTVIPFQEVLGERARLTLWLLMGAAAFVMIISCANVANLTLMRGVGREQELVIRAALGAGAARLRRLLLVENLVLTFLGAALGIVIALAGLQLLISLAARYSPRADEIKLDGMVLSFTVLLSVLVALLLAYAPTLAKEGTLGAWIASGMNRMSGTVKRQRLQRALVVAQIAVSVMLMAGAGLLTRTMLQLSQVSTGLNAQNILTMEVPFDYLSRSNDDAKAFFERMRREISALPGVAEVGIGSTMPLRDAQVQLELKAEGRPLASGEAIPRAEFRTASPEFFRASGMSILKGREFLTTDRDSSGLVVIINKTLADRLFPNRDPIGQRIAWTGDVLRFIGIPENAWRTVVGVVGDIKDGGLDAEPRGVVYQPLPQQALFSGGLVIRTAQQRDPTAFISAATKIIRGIVPQDPIENVLTVSQIADQSVAPRRLNAALVSSFGVLAVVIAAIGIAGVLAFSVSARTTEIGIRMSLGADSGRVQRMILREGGVLLVIGLALGVLGSLLAAQLIRGLLFGVTPNDPVTLAIVALLMTAIGVAACWLPALRAARIDPMVAIRAQ
jgi:putative ABC transport system permease protein